MIRSLEQVVFFFVALLAAFPALVCQLSEYLKVTVLPDPLPESSRLQFITDNSTTKAPMEPAITFGTIPFFIANPLEMI